MVTAAVIALVIFAAGLVVLIGYFLRPREAPAEHVERPSSGWEFVFLGAIVSLAAGAAAYAEAPAWLWGPLAWFASILVAVGVIGVGVTVGLLRADHARR